MHAIYGVLDVVNHYMVLFFVYSVFIRLVVVS